MLDWTLALSISSARLQQLPTLLKPCHLIPESAL